MFTHSIGLPYLYHTPIILRCAWTSYSRDPLICEPEGVVNVQNTAQCLKESGRKCWLGSCRGRESKGMWQPFFSLDVAKLTRAVAVVLLRAGHPDYCPLWFSRYCLNLLLGLTQNHSPFYSCDSWHPPLFPPPHDRVAPGSLTCDCLKCCDAFGS